MIKHLIPINSLHSDALIVHMFVLIQVS